MKTKIRRFGKRSLSILLTLLMLISTMLVGMVTANAALTPTTTSVADGYCRIFVTDNVGWGSNLAIYYWVGSSTSGEWKDAPNMIKLDGTNTQGQSVYYYDIPEGSSFILRNKNVSGNENQTVNLPANDGGTSFTLKNGLGLYFAGKNSDDKRYMAEWDASAYLPSETTYKLMTNHNGTDEELGTFDENGSLTPENLAAGTTYKLYVLDSNDKDWFSSAGAFTNKSVNLYKNDDYTTHTIEFEPRSGYSYTFNWGNVIEDRDPRGTLSYTETQTVVPHSITTGSQTNITSVTYSVNGSPVTSAAAGSEVLVTATPASDYVLDTVNVTDANGGNVETTVTGNTAKFTMPDSAVTVDLTTRAASKYTVTAESSDTTKGSVYIGSSGITTAEVTEGQTVTITAEPNSGHKFSSWSAKGRYGHVSDIGNSITIRPRENVTVTANFAEDQGTQTDLYLIYNTNDTANNLASNAIPIYKSSSGEFYADFGASGVTLSKNQNYYFALSSSDTDYTKMYWNGSGDKAPTVGASGTYSSYVSASGQNKDGYNFGRFSFSSDDVKNIRIIVGKDDGNGNVTVEGYDYTYTIVPTVDIFEHDVKIIAKNGTVVDGGTQNYGVTTIAQVENVTKLMSDSTTYKTYGSQYGTTIAISTTVNEAQFANGNGWYVAGYQINGETVPVEYQGNRVYTARYTIPSSGVTDVEITPVYFNSKIEADGDYITFYVDSSQLSTDWDQVACYPYYYTSTDATAVFNDGAYPGQPMLRAANGMWYTKVARHYYELTNGAYEQTTYTVSGMTISDYRSDEVHVTGNNYDNQSYDFDDFVAIANADYDVVQFRVEYRDSKTSNQSLIVGDSYNGYATIPAITIPTHEKYTTLGAGSALKDYKGNYVSATYDILDSADAESKINSDEYLRIISVGNQNISGHGLWSTVWYVYGTDGNLLTYGVPSDFIRAATLSADEIAANENVSRISTALANYTDYPALVCYEDIMNGNSNAEKSDYNRIDGQWYFGTTADPVTATVKCQIPGTGDTWVDDSTVNTATIDGEASVTYLNRTTTGNLVATPGTGYQFAGWYSIADDGSYVPFTGANFSNPTVSMTINENYNFVARFVPITDGTLVINHSRYTGVPEHNGNAVLSVTANYYTAEGTLVKTVNGVNSAFIDDFTSSDSGYIEYTLSIDPEGRNNYLASYFSYQGQTTPTKIISIDQFTSEDSDYITKIQNETDSAGNITNTIYSFTGRIELSDIFHGNTQLIKTLNFYSEIEPVTGKVTLNYQYQNRFNETRVYTKTVTLSSAYIDSNGYRITDALVYEHAPAIDDLTKDCKWTCIGNPEGDESPTVTIVADQTIKTCDVVITYPDSNETTEKQVITRNDYTYNELLRTETDEYYICPATDNEGNNFLYWRVYELTSEGTKGTREVARFYQKEFSMRIVDDYYIEAFYGDTQDTTANVYIDTTDYSREQYTDENGNDVDLLYADFLVAYLGTDYSTLLNSDPSYRTGIIIERTDTAVLAKNDDGSVNADYSNIKFDSNNDKLKTIAGLYQSSKTYKYNVNNNYVYATNFTIDSSKYNNLNRLDYYVYYTNNEKNTNAVMKAYYYCYKVDESGTMIDDSYVISDGIYFNLYEVSTIEPDRTPATGS